jgi:hypothetical protein
LVKRTGQTLPTANRWLDALAKVRLAKQLRDGRWKAVRRNLDVVAEELGTTGSSERLAKQIELSREGYAGWLEEQSKPRLWNGKQVRELRG